MSPAAGAAAKKAGEKISALLGSWGFWAVVFVAGFAAYFYFKGRKKGKDSATKELKEDLIVSVNPKLLTESGGKSWDPKPITDRLYTDIYKVFGLRDTEVYMVLMAMPDEKIKAVANDWVIRYFDEDNETLKKAISDESEMWLHPIQLLGVSYNGFNKLRDALVAKMTNLKLG